MGHRPCRLSTLGQNKVSSQSRENRAEGQQVPEQCKPCCERNFPGMVCLTGVDELSHLKYMACSTTQWSSGSSGPPRRAAKLFGKAGSMLKEAGSSVSSVTSAVALQAQAATAKARGAQAERRGSAVRSGGDVVPKRKLGSLLARPKKSNSPESSGRLSSDTERASASVTTEGTFGLGLSKTSPKRSVIGLAASPLSGFRRGY